MRQIVLAGVLAIQVLIVAAIWLISLQGPATPEPFLQFDQKAADRLVVGTSDESIELRREGDQWQMPDGNPADKRKIDRVLEKLADISGDWPVATSESTAMRFEVTDDAYQKHISVYSGSETIADVYLGTSPSFRKVHARSVNGGPIYAIEFSNHEAGTTFNSWLDKSLLRPVGPIAALERVDSYILTDDEEGWQSVPDVELDESKVRSYMDRFETLTVFELSDTEIGDNEPKARFEITDEEGTFTLSVYYIEESEDWIAHSDRHVSHYGLATYVGTELVKDLAELAPDEEEAEDLTITTEDITTETD